MARKQRIHYPGAFYHVIARGNAGQKIFRKAADYHAYLDLLRHYKQRYCFHLYAYVLMTNHVHLLLEVEDVALARIMQGLQFRYTQLFNRKYRISGHLFQGRYKAILCEQDAYLLELSAYIHLNPVRARLSRDPSGYAWSSYGYYSGENADALITPDIILGQFAKGRAAAQRAYARYVNEHLPQGHRADYYQIRDQRFLGDDDFITHVQKNAQYTTKTKYDISIRELANCVGIFLDLQVEELHSIARNRQGALGRALVAYLGKNLCRFENKAIAQVFKRDPVTVSQGIKRVEQMIRDDSDFAASMQQLEKRLTKGKKKYLIT